MIGSFHLLTCVLGVCCAICVILLSSCVCVCVCFSRMSMLRCVLHRCFCFQWNAIPSFNSYFASAAGANSTEMDFYSVRYKHYRINTYSWRSYKYIIFIMRTCKHTVLYGYGTIIVCGADPVIGWAFSRLSLALISIFFPLVFFRDNLFSSTLGDKGQNWHAR